MAKAILKPVPTDTLPATHRLLSEISHCETDHIHAAEAVERIAELLFDNCQHNEERMTDIQVAGLCSALTIISKWQALQAYGLGERASKAIEELGVEP
jgi:hypothetical protein